MFKMREMWCTIVIAIVIATLIVIAFEILIKDDSNLLPRHDSTLVVIAHPDDECLFFGPTIATLLRRKCRVYMLCLSTGIHFKSLLWLPVTARKRRQSWTYSSKGAYQEL